MSRPAWWDKIERSIRKIPSLPSSVHSLLNDKNKMVFHQGIPSGVDGNAKAYVTTEDTNDDGNIEKVNLVITNLEKEWPQDVLAGLNSLQEDDPMVQQIAESISSTLIHELAHIDDHKDGEFPGAEAVAESAERQFQATLPNRSAFTTNTYDRNIAKSITIANQKGIEMKKDLLKLANHLDSIGHSDLADRLDAIISVAQAMPEMPEMLEMPEMPKMPEISDQMPEMTPPESTEMTPPGSLTPEEELQNADVEPVTIGDAEAATQAANELAEEEDMMTMASDDTEERIRKMASLLSGEFGLNNKLVRR